MKPPPLLTFLCLLGTECSREELTPEEIVNAHWKSLLEWGEGGFWEVAENIRRATGCAVSLVAQAAGNLVQFGVMIEKMTGKPALQYNNYGCYCGIGGSHWPVDETDWCCQAHDCCYGRLEKQGCEPKLERYLFSVSRDNIFCAGRTSCQRQTCECDRRAALCFRRHLGTYNRKYANYPNKLCTGPTPPCWG